MTITEESPLLGGAAAQPDMEKAAVASGQATRGKADSEAVKLPPSVIFIIGNEFCERFSFYGLRAILALFLVERLALSESQATEAIHLFIVAAYMFPFLGAFLSDSYWGKYSTILSLSLVYCTGNLAVSYSATVASTMSALHWCVLGLALLAIGSGGIKPCVAAFGGDQIELTNPPGPARDRLVRWFFSYFYFAINLGSTLSTIFTPLVRVNVSYAAAFAMPAALMIVATLIFWSGRKSYVHQAPEGNVVAEVIAVIWYALIGRHTKAPPTLPQASPSSGAVTQTIDSLNFLDSVNAKASIPAGKSSSSTPGIPEEAVAVGPTLADGAAKEEEPLLIRKLSRRGSKKPLLPPGVVLAPHWLDRAKTKFGEQRVEDVKQLLRVLILFLPTPIFWSLYDQLASRWVFQAGHMDGTLPFGITVYPDQMSTLNSVLILVMIPLFDQGIYPLAERMGMSLRPIGRMALGMLFAALSFIATGFIQVWIENCGTQPAHRQGVTVASSLLPAGADPVGPACVSLLWQIPQYVLLTAGEILLSITGLELAYSQAPPSMASVVQAAWLVTDAAGNLVTVVLVGTVTWRLSQSQEFFFFAFLCVLAMCLLLHLGRGFTYLGSAEDEEPTET